MSKSLAVPGIKSAKGVRSIFNELDWLCHKHGLDEAQRDRLHDQLQKAKIGTDLTTQEIKDLWPELFEK